MGHKNDIKKQSNEPDLSCSIVQPKVRPLIQPLVQSKIRPMIAINNEKMAQAKLEKEKQESSSKMPEEVQAKMENSFGQDFSDVNIHNNSTKAEEMGAKAFAQGKDVHFAPGEFQPNTKQGQELLGHELTHVVQQKEGKVQGGDVNGKDMVNQDPALEKEADEAGKLAANNLPIQKFNSNKLSSSVSSVIQQNPVAPVVAGAGLFGIEGLEAVEAITLGLSVADPAVSSVNRSGGISYTQTTVSRYLDTEPQPFTNQFTRKILFCEANTLAGLNNVEASFYLDIASNEYGEFTATVMKDLENSTAFNKSELNLSVVSRGMFPREGGEKDPRAWPMRFFYEGYFDPMGNGAFEFQGEFEFNAFGYYRIIDHKVKSRSLADFAIIGNPTDSVYTFMNHDYTIPPLPPKQLIILKDRIANDPNYNPPKK